MNYKHSIEIDQLFFLDLDSKLLQNQEMQAFLG